ECGKCGSNITKRFLTDYVVHGAGISVENALSWHNKKERLMRFEDESYFNDSKQSKDNFGTANFMRYLDKNKTYVTKLTIMKGDAKDLGISIEI
ncbi:unnamed protein product, partial [Brugia timori]|uniref:Type II restriction endonuclease n=1 Tax=Brugia timori TaxID=42155 RepID=A0A0R3RBE7_9BILA